VIRLKNGGVFGQGQGAGCGYAGGDLKKLSSG